MHPYKKPGQKEQGEVHTADEQFKRNSNLGHVGEGPNKVMVQHGHGNSNVGNNKEGHASGHGGKRM